MSENIFFDLDKLKTIGKNVIIGKTVRIRYPELVEIGDNVIIDDFTYISTSLKVHSYVHISSGCKLIGGKEAYIEFNEFSTLSPGVVLAAGSDDYIGGIATPLVPAEYKGNVVHGRIVLGKHCIIGSNSVVLPNVICSEGSSVGALSLVNCSLEEWTLYGGVPVHELKKRDKEQIKKLEEAFYRDINKKFHNKEF